MRAYISGPLQASTDLSTARKLYEEVATIAADAGLEPYLPHLQTDPERASHIPAVDVYRRDVAALLDSDVVIAHVGAPSTGVGAELALAARQGIAIVAIARADEPISRFAAGLVDDAGGRLIRFADSAELQAKLAAQLVEAVRPTRERLAG